MILGVFLGISITFNIIALITLKIFYSKFIKNNPLSIFSKYEKIDKKENNNKNIDIIEKLKKYDMEYWDI